MIPFFFAVWPNGGAAWEGITTVMETIRLTSKTPIHLVPAVPRNARSVVPKSWFARLFRLYEMTVYKAEYACKRLGCIQSHRSR